DERPSDADACVAGPGESSSGIAMPSSSRHPRLGVVGLSHHLLTQRPLQSTSCRRGGTADAPDLGSGARKGLEVQFLSPTLPRFWPVLMRRAVAGGLELRFR